MKTFITAISLQGKDLLKGIIMASANDGIVAMAEKIAGTEKAFVDLMNKM